MPEGKGTYGTKKGRPPKKEERNGRSKLDANKDGKISTAEFARLRTNKKKKGELMPKMTVNERFFSKWRSRC